MAAELDVAHMQVELTAAARVKRSDREAQLLDTIEALVLNEGASAVTMERIAEEVGVAKPVVYRHFGNSGAALLAVLERRWAGIDPDLEIIFQAGVGAEAKIRESVERYLGDLAADRYRIRRLLAATLDDPTVARAYRARLDRRSSLLATILVRERSISEAYATTLATLCIGALSRLGDKVSDPSQSAQALADAFARFIVGGINAATRGNE
jgi:AcrR family transcriptional regulator